MDTLIGICAMAFLAWLFIGKRFQSQPGSKNWAYDAEERLRAIQADIVNIERALTIMETQEGRLDRLETEVKEIRHGTSILTVRRNRGPDGSL
ncbi:hypothetical protein M1N56_06330 [Dehalococcoidia bacterium]|nr:hypothetical protein [Dehalococcoidia bacterium]